MRRRHHAQVDEASLQTDVMRFMAIVAFCLIAILAMVRNVEAPPPMAEAEPAAAPPLREAIEEPVDEIVEPEPAVPVPVVTPPPPAPEPPNEIVEEEPLQASVFVVRQTPAPIPQPEPVVTEPVVEESSVQPTVESVPEQVEIEVIAESNAPPAAAEEPAEDEGLTLRFASEADFLRLVARGKVAVYAFDESRFLTLSPDYRFQPASPPGQVYELDPGTIPRQMHRALSGTLGTSAPAPEKWAVGLPPRVQQQIQEFVASVDSGELLIDRYEEVRHVASR